MGLSSRGDKRLKDHLRTYNRPVYKSYDKALYRWMRKHYGQVTFEILEECSQDALLLLMEMKWIHVMRARGHRLFNATEGGDGFATYTPTAAHRVRMSQNLPRYPKGPGHPSYGKKFLPEQNGMFGKKHTDESKGKISAKHKGKILSEDHKRKISLAGKGKGGRDTSGSKHPQAKLSEADVLEMRKRRTDGEPLKDLADSYCISAAHVSRICLRQTWKHI